MRTTFDLDDDVLAAAKALAKARQTTAGRLISDTLRRAIQMGLTDDPAPLPAGAAATGVYGFVGRKVSRHITDADDTPGRNRHIGHRVKAAGRINHTAVFDQDFHFFRRENKKLTQAEAERKRTCPRPARAAEPA